MLKYKLEIVIITFSLIIFVFFKMGSVLYRLSTPHYFAKILNWDFDLSAEEISSITANCKFSDDFKNYLQNNFVIPENTQFIAKKCKDYEIALIVDTKNLENNNKILAIKKQITDIATIEKEYGIFRKVSGFYSKKVTIKNRNGVFENATLMIKDKEILYLLSLQSN